MHGFLRFWKVWGFWKVLVELPRYRKWCRGRLRNDRRKWQNSATPIGVAGQVAPNLVPKSIRWGPRSPNYPCELATPHRQFRLEFGPVNRDRFGSASRTRENSAITPHRTRQIAPAEPQNSAPRREWSLLRQSDLPRSTASQCAAPSKGRPGFLRFTSSARARTFQVKLTCPAQLNQNNNQNPKHRRS